MRIVRWIPKATQTYTQYLLYLMLFHSNSGCKNSPQWYVLRTMSVLFTVAGTSSVLL